jgi:Cu+-exporting ATPase
MGLLIKGGEVLQRAGDVDTVVLDKTGTVTEGAPAVARVTVLGSLSESEVLSFAAALDRHSEHPVAAAIVRAAHAKELPLYPATDFMSRTGSGVTGKVQGHELAVGNGALMRELGIPIEDPRLADEASSQQAMSDLYVAMNGRVVGAIAVSDSLRPTSRDAVQKLQQMEIEVVLLTGDRFPTAKAIAQEVGIQRVVAEVLPQDKVAEIRRLQALGRVVAMVGDGINDAPALAQSDVGISMPKGTDIAIEASDIALMRSDLRGVPAAISLSRQTMATMKQNLFWAFVYNVIGIPIAAGVLYPFTGVMLSPIIASAAMALSSVSVVTNSLRLRHARVS